MPAPLRNAKDKPKENSAQVLHRKPLLGESHRDGFASPFPRRMEEYKTVYVASSYHNTEILVKSFCGNT